MERVKRPVVEALKEQQEAEDRGHAEGRGEEPGGLSERVSEEDREVSSDRAGEGESVVRTDSDETCYLVLTKREADESEDTMKSDGGPETADAAPGAEGGVSLGTPEE